MKVHLNGKHVYYVQYKYDLVNQSDENRIKLTARVLTLTLYSKQIEYHNAFVNMFHFLKSIFEETKIVTLLC